MKNYLIITVGTRDVQTKEELLQTDIATGKLTALEQWTDKKSGAVSISRLGISGTTDSLTVRANTNPEYAGFYVFTTPRTDGETLLAHLPHSLTWLTFPLIEKPLDWIHTKVGQIDTVLLVFTNQSQQSNFHWRNDTLHFSRLIAAYLQNHPATTTAQLEEYSIQDQPVNIDYQYTEFEKNKGGLLNQPIGEVANVFLLAQGGIDQINTALTLKLIEHFPGKVRYLQQPEDKQVEERKFPRLFLNNLNRAKANELLGRYDFNAVLALIYDKKPRLLAQLGDMLRNMHVLEAQTNYNQLIRVNYENTDLLAFWQTVDREGLVKVRQQLLFLNAIIELEQKQFNEALLRLRTLGEVLLNPTVAAFLQEPDLASRKKFDAAIQRVTGLANYLEQSLAIHRPQFGWFADAKTLRAVYDYQYIDDQKQEVKSLTKLSDDIDCLRELRNKLVHSALPVTITDFNNELKLNGSSLEKLLVDLYQYFNPVQNKGIFDTIRDEIRKLL